MSTRSSHRVPVGDLSEVRVSVITLAGQEAEGTLVELTTGGAEVRLPKELARVVQIGHMARLKLVGPSIAEPVQTTVRLQYVSEEADSDHLLCGFNVLEPARFEQSLGAEVRDRFNRRKMSRVTPGAGDPIWVRLKAIARGGTVEKARGDLADISGIGLGVLVESHSAAPFEEAEIVDLCFKLPSWEAELNLVGRVRYRLRLVRRFRFGIEFDPGRSEGFERQQGLILQYIQERQRALVERSTSD